MEDSFMRIYIILIIFFLFLVCAVPSDSLMEFQYKCAGTNATTTTYSYLKEPRVEETGYTRGLKSSSFNYLENGSIDLEENIKYFYGNGTNITNASIDHSMKVEFNGTRGISEFFAKGFFGNNRWISAWKKIRYEMSPSMKKGSEAWVNRPSNDIKVDASAVMDTNNRMNYKFNYNAEIKNGVMEAKDSTGWTNRTGAKRYDWVYESLTSGKELAITNNLFESERIVPAAGPTGDWLPCFCSGTMPAIEQLDEGWPSYVTKTVLEANRILPSAQLSPINATFSRFYSNGVSISSVAYRHAVADKRAVIGNIGLMNKNVPLSTQTIYLTHLAPQVTYLNFSGSNMTGSSETAYYPETRNLKVGIVASLPGSQSGPLLYNTSHKVQPRFDCKEGDCEGFEGIYTYDEGPTAERTITAAGGEVPELSIKNIDITLDVFERNSNTTYRFGGANSSSAPLSPAKQEMYKITVHNSGSVALSDVILSAEMAKGIRFVNARYYGEGRGDPDLTVLPESFNENIKTTLTFKFNIMDPGEVKSVILEAYAKADVDKTKVSVEVNGKAPDGDGLRDSQNSANINECELRNKDNPNDQCDALQKLLGGEGCVEVCPDWGEVK
jgi:hypothetical protein